MSTDPEQQRIIRGELLAARHKFGVRRDKDGDEPGSLWIFPPDTDRGVFLQAVQTSSAVPRSVKALVKRHPLLASSVLAGWRPCH
jgi:hypothetical protein